MNVINYDDVSLKNAIRNDDGTYTLKHAQDVNTSVVIPKTTKKNLFKPNTKYLLAVNIIENNTGTVLGLSGINSPFPVSTNTQRNFEDVLGWQFKTFTTNSDITVDDSGRPVYNYMYFGIWKDGGDLSTSIKFKFMLIEYQNGMENWDIPYFESMASVKAPVLHSVGKNLFDMNRHYDNITNAQATVVQNVDEITVSSVESGTYVNVNFRLDKNLFKGKTITGRCLYESDEKGIGTVQINYQDTAGNKYYQSIKTPKTFTFPDEIVGEVL